MISLFPGYEIALGLFFGVQCVFLVLVLCAKTSKRASMDVEKSSSDTRSSAPLISDDSLATVVRLDLKGETQNGEGDAIGEKNPNEGGEQLNAPRPEEMVEDTLTRNQIEQTYEEIDLEYQPYETYFAIQETTKEEEAHDSPEAVDHCQPIECNYSTIENIPDASSPYYNLRGASDAPLIPKPRAVDGNARGSSSNTTADVLPVDPGNVSQLYTKVMKRKNGDSTDARGTSDLEDHRAERCDLREQKDVKEHELLRRSVDGALIGLDLNVSKDAGDGLYSRVNKKRNTVMVAQGDCKADEWMYQLPKKFASGNIYSECSQESQTSAGVEDSKEEESHPYEELDLQCTY